MCVCLCVYVVHVYIICIMTHRLIYGTLTDMAINIPLTLILVNNFRHIISYYIAMQ